MLVYIFYDIICTLNATVIYLFCKYIQFASIFDKLFYVLIMFCLLNLWFWNPAFLFSSVTNLCCSIWFDLCSSICVDQACERVWPNLTSECLIQLIKACIVGSWAIDKCQSSSLSQDTLLFQVIQFFIIVHDYLFYFIIKLELFFRIYFFCFYFENRSKLFFYLFRTDIIYCCSCCDIYSESVEPTPSIFIWIE